MAKTKFTPEQIEIMFSEYVHSVTRSNKAILQRLNEKHGIIINSREFSRLSHIRNWAYCRAAYSVTRQYHKYVEATLYYETITMEQRKEIDKILETIKRGKSIASMTTRNPIENIEDPRETDKRLKEQGYVDASPHKTGVNQGDEITSEKNGKNNADVNKKSESIDQKSENEKEMAQTVKTTAVTKVPKISVDDLYKEFLKEVMHPKNNDLSVVRISQQLNLFDKYYEFKDRMMDDGSWLKRMENQAHYNQDMLSESQARNRMLLEAQAATVFEAMKHEYNYQVGKPDIFDHFDYRKQGLVKRQMRVDQEHVELSRQLSGNPMVAIQINTVGTQQAIAHNKPDHQSFESIEDILKRQNELLVVEKLLEEKINAAKKK